MYQFDAVVGDHHPVALEREQHDARLARERADVEVRLEPHAQAHRREVGGGQVTRVMARWVDESAARVLDGEAESVVDHAALRLVVAGEPREDRQARGVGRRPPGRPDLVRAQVPGRACPRVPAAVALLETAELVEAAGALVEQQRVMVASAFDVHALRDRVSDMIALVAVLERDSRTAGLLRDHVEWDSDLRAFPEARAEVRVEARRGADRVDDRCGVARDRELVDALVPRVRLREDRTAWGRGNPERERGAAGARKRQDDDGNGGGSSSHAVAIGRGMSVSDPSRQVPKDLLPAASLSSKPARVGDGTVPKV